MKQYENRTMILIKRLNIYPQDKIHQDELNISTFDKIIK